MLVMALNPLTSSATTTRLATKHDLRVQHQGRDLSPIGFAYRTEVRGDTTYVKLYPFRVDKTRNAPLNQESSIRRLLEIEAQRMRAGFKGPGELQIIIDTRIHDHVGGLGPIYDRWE